MVAQKILDTIEENKVSIQIWVVRVLLKILLFLYDVVSYVPHLIFANPHVRLKKSREVKAAPIVKADPASPWRSCYSDVQFLNDEFLKCKVLGDVWDKAVDKYYKSPCFGTRKFISASREVRDDGRIFEMLELGSYKWKTFEEVDRLVKTLMKGLHEIEHQPNERVLIYSDTCEEFSVTLLASFKSKFPVVTVYASLGAEALAYSLNDCKPSTVFTSAKLFKTMAAALKNNESVRNVVYYSHRDSDASVVIPDDLKFLGIRVLSYEKLLAIGNEIVEPLKCQVKPEDVAMIMYTSGTTATPKGVVLLHKNLVASITAHIERFGFGFKNLDSHVAYLPLAHMFEICAELTLLSRGCKVGFSSPLTLFDGSPGLKRGQLGDCSILKPSFFVGTPAIFNRITQAVHESVLRSSPWKRELFRSFYKHIDQRYDKGYMDSLLGWLVFRQIRSIIGGKVRCLFTAGAPMNPETHRFMKICFACPFDQGYGSTETGGSGAVCYLENLNSDEVGPPQRCCDILLREWEEGGYSPKNPLPQGEILIGGDNIAWGYLNNEEQTKEAFFEMYGKRWFATGDIGEVHPNGSLRIIDRKKDLVKLAQGEYISLGKVEAFISAMPFIENICLTGNSLKDYIVSVIVPRNGSLFSLARSVGVLETNFEKLCHNKKVKAKVVQEIQDYCKGKLHKMEIPQKVHLCHEPWTPNSGLVTAAFKIKRRCIEKKFENEIKAMYESS